MKLRIDKQINKELAIFYVDINPKSHTVQVKEYTNEDIVQGHLTEDFKYILLEKPMRVRYGSSETYIERIKLGKWDIIKIKDYFDF